MAIFRSLTFDGINSLDYGIYITGEAVYNAPERDVEMVTIPGKNGALALDQGRFENIEVTYHAGCFADSQTDFADKVMKFRNALASRYTYKRLTDEYHPDEYRLGLYKSGLDVEAVRYGTAGQFDITFDCKPQRFLLSGETAVTPSDYGNPQTETGEVVTIDSDGSLGVKSLEVSLSPIQEGSGTPSPTNVRPISGRTEVVTQRTGKNLLNPTLTSGANAGITATRQPDNSYKLTGTATSTAVNIWIEGNYITDVSTQLDNFKLLYLKAGTVVTFKDCKLFFYDIETGRVNTNFGYSNVPIGSDAITLTVPHNVWLTGVRIPDGVVGETYNTTVYPQLEFGSTATAYEPYQGDTYTTSLGQTVYGGTLDVVTGELVVDRAMITLDGSEDEIWTRYNGGSASAYAMQAPMDNALFTLGRITCKANYLESITSDATWGNYDAFISMNAANNVKTGVRGITTVEAWREYLAQNPLQVVYELASPQTIQLSPQQISLLLGTNHLWSDGGEITVTYGVHPYYNPSPFDAKPLIKVTGRGTLGIGEYILTITGTATQTLYIDCETMEIYTYEGTVPTGASSLVSINKNDFPVLKPGINNISVGSGITAVTITPRWWRI